MAPVTLIVCGLAVWRLSRAIVKEDGPLMVFARLRAYLALGQANKGGMFDLVSCMACTSVWVGLLVALWPAKTLFELILYGMSFSALSLLLEALMSSQKH